MGIDMTKLEEAVRQGSNTIARCPACAEAGGDRKGEHLFINEDGQFGCVLFPGEAGHAHRQRIFELVGAKERPRRGFEVRKLLPTSREPVVIQKDIFGTLGTPIFNSRTKGLVDANRGINKDIQKDLEKPVPSVPEPETNPSMLTPPSIHDGDKVRG
jgi:hypothetical protein